jgi:hypothetical protein
VLAPLLDEGELEPCGVVEGCVLPGAVVPGVVVFGVPFGAVDPGVVAPGVAPRDVEPGVAVFGAVPGVVEFGVAPGLVDSGAVEFGVPFGDVDPGVVCVVPAGGVALPAGEVAFPGVELWPVVPELPEGAALPPDDGELCATAQSVQHRITDSNVSFFMDVICASYACRVSGSRPRACCLCVESRFKYFRLGCGVSGRVRNLARNIQRWMRPCKEVARASCRLRRIVLVWCFREDNQQHVRVVLPRASTLEGHHPERSWNQRPPVRI